MVPAILIYPVLPAIPLIFMVDLLDLGGDLGEWGPGQMQKPFEDATFALQAGQMSGVVDTESGVHVILRTA
jgi:parvulin-like peptidyl-prolyl isomerase